MKKITSLLIALVLCLSLVAPVFATENAVLMAPAETNPAVSDDSGFVPSITYKPNPEIVPVKDKEGNDAIGVIRDENGEIIDYMYDNEGHGCLLITPIAHVWDPEVEVPADVERLLTFVYEELNSHKMTIPYDKHEDLELKKNQKMVIRDLFDARWVCETHRALIEEEGIQFEITFDLGVAADTPIYVMTYDEETKEWSPIVKTVNNGDGTVTCNFEHLCAIEFSMPVTVDAAPAVIDFDLWDILPWIIALLVALLLVVIIIIIAKKKGKKEQKA